MPLDPRGGIDLDQILITRLSGGVNADQAATGINEPRPEGNIVVFDAFGNYVNSGISLALILPLLNVLVDDDGNPVVDDDGNAILAP